MGTVTGRESLYSTPTRVLAVVAWAFCALFAVNLLMTGTAASIWHFLPWLLLAAWAVFVLLWRPRLVVHPDGLTVVNILRDHDVPFARLTAVRVTQTVILDTSEGRIPSWGAPGVGKLGPRRLPGGKGSGRADFAVPPTQLGVDAAWDAWETRNSAGAPAAARDEPAVTHRWNVPAAVVGLVLAVLAVVSVFS